MPNNYSDKIKQARDAGYSDDEIVSFIAKSDPKMAEASAAGYSGADILKHLEGSGAPAADNRPWYQKSWDELKGGFAGPKKVQQEVSEGQLETAPRFTTPGSSTTPLAEGLSEAGSVANFGVTPGVGGVEASLPGLISDVKSVPAALKEGAAVALRAPDGKLRPTVRGGSRLAGAYAGHMAAGTEGAVAGALAGPAIAEGLAPKRVPTARVQQETIGGFMNKGYKPVEAPTVPEQLAQEPSKILRPSDPSARMTGSEGTAARWTNERVMELAKQGNHEAIQQAVRRGMKLPDNARYVAGDASYSSGVYNPRDVTIFGPDGTPVKQGGKRLTVASKETPKPANKFAGDKASKIESAATDNPDFKFEEVRREIDRIKYALRGTVPAEERPVLESQLANYQEQMSDLTKPANAVTMRTDSLGVKWAETPDGVRVSIPKSVPDAEVQQYAKQKLAEQVAMRGKMGVK